jgi:hypothetical protein
MSVGTVAAAIVAVTLMGAVFRSGLGVVIGTLAGVLVGGVAVTLFAAVTAAAAIVARALPARFLVALGGTFGALIALNSVLSWPDQIYYRSLTLFVGIQALLVGALWLIATGQLKAAPWHRRVVVMSTLFLTVAVDLAGILWLASSGTLPPSSGDVVLSRAAVTALDAPHPAESGPYLIRTLYYGSGTDKRRPEFRDSIYVKTDGVDASPLLPEWRGFNARMREWYWGFGIDSAPINGRVWFPEGEGRFPLVLFVHGNHMMEEHSDPGYDYLGELLASRGLIVVSVDENFVNRTWSGDFRGAEMPVRAWLLLQHLRQWHEWNRTEGTPFFQKVDTENIALIGHSRGGEAVAVAAAFNKLPFYPDNAMVPFDFDFSIKALVAIAPTDKRYHRRLSLENVNYLALQGSYDTDEASFFGIRQYQRVAFTSSDRYWFKSGLYIHGANHRQFNTVWGRKDTGPPRSWLLNMKPIIPGEEQRQVAKIYISAFLEATLRGNYEYTPLFRDPRVIAEWLPDTDYRHRFEDSSFRVVADYEEDIDLSTATVVGSFIQAADLAVWREEALRFRDNDTQQNNAAYLGWSPEGGQTENPGAHYTIALPPSYAQAQALTPEALLVFSLSRVDETASRRRETGNTTAAEGDAPERQVAGALDLAIELVDTAGATARLPLSEFAAIPPALHVRFLKLTGLSRDIYGRVWEPTLKTYELPLSSFVSANPEFESRSLQTIRFRFDLVPSGVIILDEVGFRMGG